MKSKVCLPLQPEEVTTISQKKKKKYKHTNRKVKHKITKFEIFDFMIHNNMNIKDEYFKCNMSNIYK